MSKRVILYTQTNNTYSSMQVDISPGQADIFRDQIVSRTVISDTSLLMTTSAKHVIRSQNDSYDEVASFFHIAWATGYVCDDVRESMLHICTFCLHMKIMLL